MALISKSIFLINWPPPPSPSPPSCRHLPGFKTPPCPPPPPPAWKGVHVRSGAWIAWIKRVDLERRGDGGGLGVSVVVETHEGDERRPSADSSFLSKNAKMSVCEDHTDRRVLLWRFLLKKTADCLTVRWDCWKNLIKMSNMFKYLKGRNTKSWIAFFYFALDTLKNSVPMYRLNNYSWDVKMNDHNAGKRTSREKVCCFGGTWFLQDSEHTVLLHGT